MNEKRYALTREGDSKPWAVMPANDLMPMSESGLREALLKLEKNTHFVRCRIEFKFNGEIWAVETVDEGGKS